MQTLIIERKDIFAPGDKIFAEWQGTRYYCSIVAVNKDHCLTIMGTYGVRVTRTPYDKIFVLGPDDVFPMA